MNADGPSGGGQARLWLSRRQFVLGATGALSAAAAAVYAPLAVGSGFERLVATRLGIDERLSADLLALARSHYGDIEYDARAALFALSFRSPASALVPASVKRSAAQGLLTPMLRTPAANIAYAFADRDPSEAACAGLVAPD